MNKNKQKEKGIAIALKADEGQLIKWLSSPPLGSDRWKNNHQPLLRCCELDNEELFKKWHMWGCDNVFRKGVSSIFVFNDEIDNVKNFKNVFLDEMIEKNPKSALWLLDLEKKDFLMGVGALVRAGKINILNKINWSVAMDELNHSQLTTIGLWSLFGEREFVPLSKTLDMLDGDLSRVDNYLGFKIAHIRYYGDTNYEHRHMDDLIASRINKIESGKLKNIHWKMMREICLPFSMQSALEQIKFNGFEIDSKGKSSPKSWRSLMKTIYRQEEKLNATKAGELIDDLIECGIDFGKPDKAKATVYHALDYCINKKNEKIIYAMAKKIHETKPVLIAKAIKNKDAFIKGYLPYMEFLKTIYSKEILKNAKEHQFNKKYRKPNVVTPRRKRIM